MTAVEQLADGDEAIEEARNEFCPLLFGEVLADQDTYNARGHQAHHYLYSNVKINLAISPHFSRLCLEEPDEHVDAQQDNSAEYK